MNLNHLSAFNQSNMPQLCTILSNLLLPIRQALTACLSCIRPPVVSENNEGSLHLPLYERLVNHDPTNDFDIVSGSPGSLTPKSDQGAVSTTPVSTDLSDRPTASASSKKDSDSPECLGGSPRSLTPEMAPEDDPSPPSLVSSRSSSSDTFKSVSPSASASPSHSSSSERRSDLIAPFPGSPSPLLKHSTTPPQSAYERRYAYSAFASPSHSPSHSSSRGRRSAILQEDPPILQEPNGKFLGPPSQYFMQREPTSESESARRYTNFPSDSPSHSSSHSPSSGRRSAILPEPIAQFPRLPSPLLMQSSPSPQSAYERRSAYLKEWGFSQDYEMIDYDVYTSLRLSCTVHREGEEVYCLF